MKKSMRKIVLAIAVLVSISILGGCGKKSDSSSSGNTKEIVFWNPFTGADHKNMVAMVDAYNKTNPTYKVKNVSIKEQDMYSKIPTVVNSGKNIPDLNIVHAERLKQFNDNGMLQSFDSYLNDYPQINSENYVPAAWNIGDIDGIRYSIPLDIHNWGMYYNKDLVEKYAPTALDDGIVTYDEIIAAGKASAKDKISGLGMTWVKPNYLGVLKQKGGSLSEDGITPTLDSPESEAAMQLFSDLYEKGVTTKDGEEPLQLFLSGKLMFFPEGIWIQNQVSKVNFDWGITNAPQISDNPENTVNWASSHQFVMFNNKDRSDEKSKAVMDFIDWVRTHSQEWAKAGQNPASLAILEDEAYTKMPQSFFLKSEAQQNTLTIFDYKYNGYVADYLEAHGFDMIFGKVSVADGLSSMQKEVSDKIAKDKN